MPPLIFRKGLDLKHEVAGVLAESYHSDLIDAIKNADFRYASGRLTIHLAREFGFCYGVDRAVDYAYQARRRFPDRTVYLTGEIIHNPHVNDELRAQGIRFLSDDGESLDALTPDDVVILPAFGVTIELLTDLERRGCTLVDTTCGSVLNVWKNVKRYAEDGFTSVIHGKYWHEETRATASQALHAGCGQYLVVLNREEAALVCRYIRSGGGREEFLARFEARRLAGVRSRPRPRSASAAPTRRRCSARSRWRSARCSARRSATATATPSCPVASARSTRSAARRRTARTPSSRCSPSSRST